MSAALSFESEARVASSAIGFVPPTSSSITSGPYRGTVKPASRMVVAMASVRFEEAPFSSPNVSTCMPASTRREQAGTSARAPLSSTTHTLHTLTGRITGS